MADVVATPETAKPAEAAKTDLRSEMVSELKKMSDADDAEQAKAAEEETVDESEEKSSDSSADSEKVEAKEDEDSEDEDSEKTEDSDKPKKPNRYQRLKAKAEMAMAQSQKYATERDEAVKIANIYRNRALALEKRLSDELARAKQVGYEVSPDADENFKLRLSLQERELQEQLQKQQAEERVREEVAAEKQEMAAEFTEQALSLSGAMGLRGEAGREFARKILRGYAAALHAGEDVSMAEIAQTLAAVSQQRKQSSQVRAQLQTNAGAPRRISSRAGGVAPDYPATSEGMTAFLKSIDG